MSVHNGRQIYEQYRELSALAGEMQYEGVMVDMDHRVQLMADVAASMKEHRTSLHALGTPVDLGSSGNTQATKDHFFGSLKAPILKYTKDSDTGRETTTPAMDGSVIQSWRQMSEMPELQEAAKYLFYFKKNAKLLSALKSLPVIDGRIYPEPKPHGTVGSRWAYANPNLQNFGKAKTETITKDGKVVEVQIAPSTRGLLRAAPGNLFVVADYSQLELRSIIYVAGLDEMKAWMEADLCPHRMNASLMFGLPYEKIPKSSPLRQQAKNGIYAFSYNFTDNVETIYEAWKKDFPEVTLKYVKNVRKRLMEAQPKLREYQLRVAESVKRLGYVEAPGLGRRRHFAGEGNDINMALNFPFQTGGGELVNRSLLQLREMWKGQPKRLVGQVHDEIIAEVREDKADEVVAEMKGVMESDFDVWGRVYNFPVDIHYGQSWGAAK